jgi:chromosome segregation ATPase
VQKESLTQKHNSVHDSLKAMEGKLAQQHDVNLALRNELDEIRRNQDKVDKSEVMGILARVKVAGVGYTLL